MISIVYEDDAILVCIKPAGICSEAADKKNDIISALQKDGKKELYLVHRLDSPTAGIMVLAKTQKAAAFLSVEIQKGCFTKEYIALVHGTPTEPEGIFEDLLYRDKQKNKTYVVKRERKGVKSAKLSYKVLEAITTETGVISRIKVHLYTGRTHQIRVQFASRKMPLLGDGKYGANDNISPLRLYSAQLCFVHPNTNKKLTFCSEPEW